MNKEAKKLKKRLDALKKKPEVNNSATSSSSPVVDSDIKCVTKD